MENDNDAAGGWFGHLQSLSVEEFHTCISWAPERWCMTEPVDIGLGGDFVLYRGTNPNYPGKVYVGQTTDLDVHGEARGSESREGERGKNST